MKKSEYKNSIKNSLKLAIMPIMIFSLAINLLLFASPLYMMQIYDRVLSSRSEMTLISLSIILFFIMTLSGFIEFIRTRMLARSGSKFSQDLDDKLFKAVSKLERRSPQTGASQYFRDADTVKDFISGNGMLAFCDVPWTPLFVIACWIIHPWIGMLALGGGIIIFSLSIISELTTRNHIKNVAEASATTNLESATALKNSESIHALGMNGAIKNRWLNARSNLINHQTIANDKSSAISTVSKTFRQLLQSAVLGLAAYLAIIQQISPGLMIAASILVGRALQPVDQMVANWKNFLSARNSYAKLTDLFQNNTV